MKRNIRVFYSRRSRIQELVARAVVATDELICGEPIDPEVTQRRSLENIDKLRKEIEDFKWHETDETVS